MPAPNRIYIEVNFLQQDAVAGVKQLNEALASVGTVTQKSAMQASQGVSNLSLTIQEAQKAAARTQLGPEYVARTKQYAEGLGLVGQAAINTANHLALMGTAMDSLAQKEAAGVKRVADLNSAMLQAGNTASDAKQKFALLDQQMDRLAEAEDIARIVKLPGDLTHLSTVVATTAKSFEYLGMTQAEAAQKSKFLEQSIHGVTEEIAVLDQRSKAFRATNVMDKGAALFDAAGAANAQAVRQSLLGIAQTGPEATKALENFRAVTDTVAASAGKGGKAVRLFSQEMRDIASAMAMTAGARSAAMNVAPVYRDLNAVLSRTAPLALNAGKSLAAMGLGAQKGARMAANEIRIMTDEVKKAQASMSSGIGLGGMFAGLSAAAVGTGILDATKDLDTLRKTLLVVEGTQEKANERFEQFLAMSQKAGVSLEPALQSYVKLSSTLELTSKEAIEVVEGVGTALGQLGLGGVEMKGAIEQISQSISKGGQIMREDLKFVQQYIPQITPILKKLYGTADTKALAEQGHEAIQVWKDVTAELRRLPEAAAGVGKTMELFWQQMRLAAEKFGQTLVPTLTERLKQVNDLLGGMAGFWKDLDPVWQRIISNSTQISLGFIAVASGIRAINAAVILLNTTILANPYARILLGITLAGAAAYEGAKRIGEVLQKAKADFFKGMGAGMAASVERELGGFKQPATAPPKKKVPTAEEIAAAKKLASYLERITEAAEDSARDAMNDLTKALGTIRPVAEQLEQQRAALRGEMERELQKKRVGMGGRDVQLPKAVLDAAARETLARESKLRIDTIHKLSEENDKYIKDYGEKWLESLYAVSEAEIEFRREVVLEQVAIQKKALLGMEDVRLKREQSFLDARKDMQLSALESTEAVTLEQQQELATKRLAIEERYIEQALGMNQMLLEVDRQRELSAMRRQAVAAKKENDFSYKEAVALTNAYYDVQQQQLSGEAREKIQLARLNNVRESAQLLRTELQRTFEYFQGLAEGVFDALLGKSKSVAQAMADFFKTTVITMIKAIYTNAIAAGMMRMFGLPVPQQAGNPVLRMLTGGGMGGGIGGGGGFSPASMFASTGIAMGTGGTAAGSSGGTAAGSSGGGLMSYVSTAGSLGGLAKMLRIGGMGSWGAKWVPAAMRGPIGAGVPGALNYGTNATNMAWTGALQTSGIAGSTGLTAALAGMGLFNTGSIAMSGYSTTAAGIGGLGGSLAGFASSPGGILAGLALMGYGAKRGGGLGAAMTTGGGALAGFGIGAMIGSVGGPLGMAIGAGVGTVIGIIGILRKSAEEKARERIQSIYRVDITDNKILQQIVQIAKDQYGGNLNLALFAPQVREVILNYKMTQSATGEGRPMYPVSFAMGNGQLSLNPVYNGGGIVPNPYSGPTTTQMNHMPVYVQLNPQQANDLFEGKVVAVIDSNPEAVANSSVRVAGDSTQRRQSAQNAILEPLTLLS